MQKSGETGLPLLHVWDFMALFIIQWRISRYYVSTLIKEGLPKGGDWGRMKQIWKKQGLLGHLPSALGGLARQK